MLKNFLNNKKGDTNTVGWIVLIIFIILAVAPQIKTIGTTMRDGAMSLNTQLTDTLED
jgi:hypothetical protein